MWPYVRVQRPAATSYVTCDILCLILTSSTNMTSLPPKVPQRLQDIAQVVSAYDICLRLERSLQLAVVNGDNVGNDIIYIRILGYLIHYLPTDQGLKTVVFEVVSAMTDRALLDVGKLYYDHYIRACRFQGFYSACFLTQSPVRANKGRIPTPSNHASRPSFDTMADMINDTLTVAPQSHSTAKKNVGRVFSFQEFFTHSCRSGPYSRWISLCRDWEIRHTLGSGNSRAERDVSVGPQFEDGKDTVCAHIR